MFEILNASKGPVKEMQLANATLSNIVESNMLHSFGHHVARCCMMLDEFDFHQTSSLTSFNISFVHARMLTKLALRVSESMAIIYCKHLLRALVHEYDPIWPKNKTLHGKEGVTIWRVG